MTWRKYSVFTVSVASNKLVRSEAIYRFTDCYSGWHLVNTGWKVCIIILLLLTSHSWKYVNIANCSYGTSLNFQSKGLAYVVAFCAQFLQLSWSNPPQSLGGNAQFPVLLLAIMHPFHAWMCLGEGNLCTSLSLHIVYIC